MTAVLWLPAPGGQLVGAPTTLYGLGFRVRGFGSKEYTYIYRYGVRLIGFRVSGLGVLASKVCGLRFFLTGA